MRVVVVHNRYRSTQPSGENRVVEADIASLRAEGVEVFPYLRDSDEIETFSGIGKVAVSVRPLASPADSLAFRRLLRTVQPHVVHLHNPYPLISPWLVRTAKAERVAVVQTVHNYRHTCASGILFRDGHECTECVGSRLNWPAIKHGCYRDSRLQSVPMAASLALHRSTWELVDRFLPVGEHVADHLRAFGIADHKIVVRRNVMSEPPSPSPPGEGVLYVGRLAEEKGIRLLLDAWGRTEARTRTTLTIAGDGELRSLVEDAAKVDQTIVYLGLVDALAVSDLYQRAAIVAVPSVWPEPDPLAAVAALANGRAVVAIRVGAMARCIDDSCGRLAEPSPFGFARAIDEALETPSEVERLGRGARARYERDRGQGQRSLVSHYEELSSLPRGTLVVVGPDGSGKSTIADRLELSAQVNGVDVSRAHFRPRVMLAGRHGAESDATAPHEQEVRALLPAIARTFVTWCDFVAGWSGPWHRGARKGFVVMERPWFDQAVDGRRYRIPDRAQWTVRLLGMVLPKADMGLELVGDPHTIHERKPEIGADEVRRQQTEWRRFRTRSASDWIVIDAVDSTVEDAIRQFDASLDHREAIKTEWMAPWGYPGRLALRTTRIPAPRGSLSVYPPQRASAILRNRLAALVAQAGVGRRAAAPDAPIEAIRAAVGQPWGAATVMRSSKIGRSIIGLEVGSGLAVVIKCGALDDAGLRNEAQILRELDGGFDQFLAPTLVFEGEVDGFFVLAMKPVVGRRRRTRTRLIDAAAIATALCNGGGDRAPLVHGDLTDWNISSGDAHLTVLDWENARHERRPLWDLAHFVVQRAALVGGDSVEDVVRILTARDSIGARHLLDVGEDASSARTHLTSYLDTVSASGLADAFRDRIRLKLV